MFLADNLEYFQGFDHVKIFYDGGQNMVSKAARQVAVGCGWEPPQRPKTLTKMASVSLACRG